MVPLESAVVAYNSSFEKARIMDLAQAFPDLAAALQAVADRIVDLLPVTRANWHHRDQRGSWSIKAVLPTIAAEMDYASLEVKDGGSAGAYAKAIAIGTTVSRLAALDAALRAYCGRDTETTAYRLVPTINKRANGRAGLMIVADTPSIDNLAPFDDQREQIESGMRIVAELAV